MTDPVLHYDDDAYGLNQLINVGNDAGDKTGSRTDLVGTVGGEDNLASVVVTNTTRTEDTPAQVRGTFYIARGIMLDVGTNELQVVAADKSGNTKTEPSSGTHDIDLDNTLDLDYTYDTAGCLEYVKDGDTGTKLFQYVYDDEHRLIEVIDDPDGGTPKTIVKFAYDALGRRIKKEIYVDGSLDKTVRYIYAGQDVIEEYLDDSGWVLEAEYVHGIGIDNLLTIERDSTTWYYHHDGLGSVTELTDCNGDLVQAYEYDAWGNVTIYNPDDTTILNPYMYTGRRWDPEIALYYYRARYYDPQHGRFIQPDPLGYKDGPNLYAYVKGRPVASRDPLGLFGITLIFVYEPSQQQQADEAAADVVEDIKKKAENFFPTLQEILTAIELEIIDGELLLIAALDTLEAFKATDGLEGFINGPGDARRHCYWSCRLAEDYARYACDNKRAATWQEGLAWGTALARKVTSSHETGHKKGRAMETAMDVHNNERGFEGAKNTLDPEIEASCASHCLDALPVETIPNNGPSTWDKDKLMILPEDEWADNPVEGSVRPPLTEA